MAITHHIQLAVITSPWRNSTETTAKITIHKICFQFGSLNILQYPKSVSGTTFK